ncbi:hypothetical protein ACGFYP_07465 [Streptomyces sp. NPDC048370]|uniref:hypothetical protein n=1 Tax=Streptomyces sp. NPDC048370 TaxID=3365540 RepID=UPI0037226877
MSRRNRRIRPEAAPATPVEASVPVPEPSVSADQLKALTDRLAVLERQQQTDAGPWSPVTARRREQDAWLASNTRTDGPDACPVCGRLGDEQRRLVGTMFRFSPAWVCLACVDVMVPGYGTACFTTRTMGETLDRLACLAAGMDRPTRSFRALAARYGLTFSLAKDSDVGDGTAWSHLGDLTLWREVGVKALRRDDAGFGVFPVVSASVLRPEVEFKFVYDASLGRRSHTPVAKPMDPPSATQAAARLAAEETAIEAALVDQERQAAERAEEAARRAERARIEAEYQAAVRAQEALFEQHRQELRKARAKVLESADTRADFNAIVQGL